jgi:hypothetical protein
LNISHNERPEWYIDETECQLQLRDKANSLRSEEQSQVCDDPIDCKCLGRQALLSPNGSRVIFPFNQFLGQDRIRPNDLRDDQSE